MGLGVGGEVVARLKAVVEVDADKLTKGLKEAESQTSKTSKVMHTTLKAAAIGAAAGIGLLTEGLVDGVKAAVEHEKALAKLKVAVHNSGLSWDQYGAKLDETIKAQAEAKGFAENDLTTAYSRLIVTTKNVAQAQHLANLAMDLSRATGKPLTATTLLLQKAYNGSNTALSRLGITLPKVTKAQDALKASGKPYTKMQMDAAKAADLRSQRESNLAAIQKKFGGQSAAYAKTAAGEWDRFHVTLEIFEESVGQKLLPLLTSALDLLLKHKDAAKYVAEAVAGITGALLVYIAAVKAYTAYQKIAAGVTAIFTTAQEGENAAMMANPIGLVVVALAALVVGLVVAYKKSETFRNIVNGAFDTLRSVVMPIIHTIETALHGMATVVGGVANLIGDIIHGRWSDVWADAERIVGRISGAVSRAVGSIPGLIRGLLGKIENAAVSIGKAILTGIETGLGDLGSWLWDKIKSMIESAIGIGHTTAQQQGARSGYGRGASPGPGRGRAPPPT
jgi:phage-related protein